MSREEIPSRVEAADNRDSVSEIADRMHEKLTLDDPARKHDVEFTVGRDFGPVKRMTARKERLGKSSAVFHAMFYGSLAENCDKPIDIPDVSPQAFSNMLSYVHTYLVDRLTPENVLSTLSCADKYDVPRLVNLCNWFIQDELYAENCLMFLEEAISWRNDQLVSQCLDTVDAFTEAVFLSQPFTAIEQPTLGIILERSTLSATEAVIYNAAQRWATAACIRSNLEPVGANRRKVLGDALFMLRFPLFTDAELAKVVKVGVLSTAEFADIQLWRTASPQPLLSFPAEPRTPRIIQIGDVKFQLKEEVFVDTDGHWYFGGEVIGVDGSEFVVAGFRGKFKRPYQKLFRAKEFLKGHKRVLARRYDAYFTSDGQHSSPCPGLHSICRYGRGPTVSIRNLVVPKWCGRYKCRRCRVHQRADQNAYEAVSFDSEPDGYM